MRSENLQIVISGAGIAGLFSAILLGRAGHRVLVVEKRTDLSSTSKSQPGRTINFTLSARGRACLREAGLLDAVLSKAVPLFGRMVHLPIKNLKLFSPYGVADDDNLHSILREDLYDLLSKEARSLESVSIKFGTALESINPFAKCAQIYSEHGVEKVGFDLLVGADGVHSKTRSLLVNMGHADVEHIESDWRYIERQSKSQVEITELNYLHVWPRWESVTCGLPTADGKLILNDIFRAGSPQALQWNSAYAITRLKVSPWFVGESTVLIGDAAHAVSPFLGQGMNMALEDAFELSRVISTARPNEAELKRFEQVRKHISDDLFDQSEEHFKTLARRTLNPGFLLSQRLEMAIRKSLPMLGKARYVRITGSAIQKKREVLL